MRHLRAHSMLHLQSDTALSVVDHPLKERDVKVEEFAKLVHCNGGPQLLVVTYFKLSVVSELNF